jgi:YD repeat-containing protein
VLATGTTVLDEQDYGYDADNDVTAQTVTAPGNPAAGANTYTYTYDRSGRLGSWTDPASTTTNYGYDAAGNPHRGGRHLSRVNFPGHSRARIAHRSSRYVRGCGGPPRPG